LSFKHFQKSYAQVDRSSDCLSIGLRLEHSKKSNKTVSIVIFRLDHSGGNFSHHISLFQSSWILTIQGMDLNEESDFGIEMKNEALCLEMGHRRSINGAVAASNPDSLP
jgi:hypothetical protein